MRRYIGLPLALIPEEAQKGYVLRPVCARPEHRWDSSRTPRLMGVRDGALLIGYFKDGDPREAEKQD